MGLGKALLRDALVRIAQAADVVGGLAAIRVAFNFTYS
jgi:hypothetical protein